MCNGQTMIREHNVGATFDRSNISHPKSRERAVLAEIDEIDRLIDRACFDSRL